jgi:hypothetical protein
MNVDDIVKEVMPKGFTLRTLQQRQPGDGLLEVMFWKGDWKGIWDPTNREETEAVRVTFDKLKSKGFMAYRVIGEKGDKGEVMREFDAKAGRIIMCPPMMGG